MKYKFFSLSLLFFGIMVLFGQWKCKKPNGEEPPVVETYPVDVWSTSSNRVNLLYHKSIKFAAGKDDRFQTIEIDSAQLLQTVDGFGFSLTGGSAYHIHRMGAIERAALLQELFGRADNGIGISYLRISIGASDLDPVVFSYDDRPSGQTDLNLQYFSLARDTIDLIPLLKEILAISPDLKIMGSPWSPPVWMKNNGSSIGGSLQLQYYGVYAQYFVKYIQAMKAHGIVIDAVTPQNEPQHGGNNPSMVLSAAQEADFVKNHLGPAFQSAGITTKIIVWDHNCDNPGYPIAILNDPAAKSFIDGSAFHLYGGDISAMSAVHDAHPDKNLYFTEQWTGGNTTFDVDFMWHIKNVIIGSMRNWSKVALEWNLAADASFNPHTPGGCTLCQGALTVNGSQVTRNVSYYIVAQAAKFVLPGSVRLGSNNINQLPNVAFVRPDGKKSVLVLNEKSDPVSFNIHYNKTWITGTLPGGTAGTFIW